MLDKSHKKINRLIPGILLPVTPALIITINLNSKGFEKRSQNSGIIKVVFDGVESI